MSNEDRTFRLSFPDEGVGRLRETVKEKLKDYMGDYTDDTLVDYVIVLIRNGRRKEEAGKELNVFLGDDSISFTSWLWDHLSSNLNLYLEPSGIFAESEEQSGKLSLQQDEMDDSLDLNSDYEIESPNKSSKIRHNKEWKGLLQDETKTLVLRSTVVDHSSKKITERHISARRTPSPKQRNHRKRSHLEEPPRSRRDEKPRSRRNEKTRNQCDEQPIAKREVAYRPMLDAPRRLLQFAVRDAVKTIQKSVSRPEPPSKRLRSVVSSTIDSSASDNTRSVPKFMGSATTALKAAEEAAQDVRFKTSVNVFDRLCHSSERPVINDPSSNPSQNGDYSQISQHLGYVQSIECGDLAEDMTMVERNTGLVSDSGSHYERYNNAGNLKSAVGGPSQIAASKPRDKNSLMVQYSASKNANDMIRKTTMKQETSNTAATNNSRKIVNISVNINTWKPSDYQVSREITEAGNHNKEAAGKFQSQSTMVNDTNKPGTKNEIMQSGDTLKEILKPVPSHGPYSNSRPSDDADSRIVFVSNVHFAATKDNLSRHFNKFGEVLKVIIVTDGATGNPTGSAYVEFLRKESTELALSLNGTSFMSRILKVVRRNMASHETSAITPWPRVARGSPFTLSRGSVGRVPFPRGIMTSPFRGRMTVKPGARSIQWKRDSSSTPSPMTEGVKNSNNIVTTPTRRNLTYIRTVEPKPDANLDPT